MANKSVAGAIKIAYQVEKIGAQDWQSAADFSDSVFTFNVDCVFDEKVTAKYLTVGTRETGDYGLYSVAIGSENTASGENSFAQGYGNIASGGNSHAEGQENYATAVGAHAEGGSTNAAGAFSHAEGNGTNATGASSHAEGFGTVANKIAAHAEGSGTTAYGLYAHAEGYQTHANARSAHSEGEGTVANHEQAHAEGLATTASGEGSHAEGNATVASSSWSHAEGHSTQASGFSSHAEGRDSKATGNQSHSEGYKTKATGDTAHAEGNQTEAADGYSHAEGSQTVAAGLSSHAEGSSTRAIGIVSHAEGQSTQASGMHSHSEGRETYAVGNQSHAEGYATSAVGANSHAEGNATIAGSQNQHVFGKNNVRDNNSTYVEIVGNGQSNGSRSNARTLDWSGNEILAGSLSATGVTLRGARSLFVESAGTGTITITDGVTGNALTFNMDSIVGGSSAIASTNSRNTFTEPNAFDYVSADYLSISGTISAQYPHQGLSYTSFKVNPAKYRFIMGDNGAVASSWAFPTGTPAATTYTFASTSDVVAAQNAAEDFTRDQVAALKLNFAGNVGTFNTLTAETLNATVFNVTTTNSVNASIENKFFEFAKDNESSLLATYVGSVINKYDAVNDFFFGMHGDTFVIGDCTTYRTQDGGIDYIESSDMHALAVRDDTTAFTHSGNLIKYALEDGSVVLKDAGLNVDEEMQAETNRELAELGRQANETRRQALASENARIMPFPITMAEYANLKDNGYWYNVTFNNGVISYSVDASSDANALYSFQYQSDAAYTITDDTTIQEMIQDCSEASDYIANQVFLTAEQYAELDRLGQIDPSKNYYIQDNALYDTLVEAGEQEPIRQENEEKRQDNLEADIVNYPYAITQAEYNTLSNGGVFGVHFDANNEKVVTVYASQALAEAADETYVFGLVSGIPYPAKDVGGDAVYLNIPAAPAQEGQYRLDCDVDSQGNATFSWGNRNAQKPSDVLYYRFAVSFEDNGVEYYAVARFSTRSDFDSFLDAVNSALSAMSIPLTATESNISTVLSTVWSGANSGEKAALLVSVFDGICTGLYLKFMVGNEVGNYWCDALVLCDSSNVKLFAPQFGSTPLTVGADSNTVLAVIGNNGNVLG